MNYSFMVDIQGCELEPIERIILTHPLVDAVILFTRNFKNREQLLSLVRDIRSINSDIFIAVDHEGGNVQRFQRNGFRAIPAARVLGEIYDDHHEAGLSAAHRYGRIMAQDLLDCGIDLSISPVIDLHGESQIIAGLDRAFHQDPVAVAQLAGAFIEGMHTVGMPAVGKHFPGHGSCRSDSHVAKPVHDVSYEHLAANDLKPFVMLIQNRKLPAVMPAHVTYPQIDAENPAGYSSIWLQDILRTQLGFEGFILSDCLSMAGADVGDLKTRAERAFAAGCNMAILANQPRSLLLELLESFQAMDATRKHNEYLFRFKQEMHRFQSQSCSETALSHTIWSREEETVSNFERADLNKTTGV